MPQTSGKFLFDLTFLVGTKGSMMNMLKTKTQPIKARKERKKVTITDYHDWAKEEVVRRQQQEMPASAAAKKGAEMKSPGKG